MVDDMIERVARKILEAQTDWLFGKDAKEDLFLTMARAAIEAMREPTLEMRHAGWRVKSSWLLENEEVEIWQNMIDESLK